MPLFRSSRSPDDLPVDLGSISLLTGIQRSHLQQMLNGELSPSPEHYYVIERVIGEEYAKRFDHHYQVEPSQYVKAGAGRTPEGTELYPQMPLEHVREGDYIQYKIPRTRVGNIAWLRVEHAEVNEDIVEIHVEGDIVFTLGVNAVIKTARPLDR